MRQQGKDAVDKRRYDFRGQGSARMGRMGDGKEARTEG